MIIRLNAETPEDIRAIGGKACGLVRMMRGGFPVPDAWCVTAGASAGGKPGPELEAELDRLWAQLSAGQPGIRVAVRSSATAEDLEGASFAGIYQTKLDVESGPELRKAASECLWAVHADRARDYRTKQNLGHDLRIALVIQRMVNSDVSGVMLTANPRRPFANEIVIDAAYGLGEAVVSGVTHPDHIVVERDTGKIRESVTGPKEIECRFVSGKGHVEREVERERRERLSLSGAQIRKLWELSRRVESSIGPNQDIEWAFEGENLFVLQQRPITGLPPASPSVVWTRKFGDEYLADYMSPLGHTVLTRWISEDYLRDMAVLSGNTELAAMEPIRRYHGYAYMNGAYIGRMMRGVPRQLRGGNTLGWFTPLWEARMKQEPFEPGSLIGVVRGPMRDYRSSLKKNPEILEEHCRNIERTIKPKLFQDYRTLSGEEWQRQFDEAYGLGSEHFRVIRWGMGFYNPLLHGVLQSTLKRFAGDSDGELYRALISGLPGTKTVEINRDIWRLGVIARENPEFHEALRKGMPCAIAREKFPGAAFWPAFDRFMEQHGHRAATREISQPRWRETPDVVLGFIRAQLHGAEPPDPSGAEAEAIKRREKAEAAALKRAGTGLRGLLGRRWLESLFRLTQTYTRYRENQRYFLDYMLCHIRNLVLEMGRRLKEQGVLADIFEVFFLEREELWALIARPELDNMLENKIEERVQEYMLWKDRLPATYLFDDVETEGEIVEGDPSGVIEMGVGQGLGASRGVSRGRARVVRELAHVEAVEPGEILVASNTDPGWTSVFPLLAGLVTETGGLLSHGALLAREYGIPAVTGVKGATATFRTGEWIEIDGGQGTVRRLTGDDPELA